MIRKLLFILFLLIFPFSTFSQEDDSEVVDEICIEEVPFIELLRFAVYPGCTGDTKDALRVCTSEKISEFVSENFNMELVKEAGIEGEIKIHAQFKVSESGEIEKVMARCPYPFLEVEAIRVINSFPTMEPAIDGRGRKTAVIYSLPIIIDLSD